MRELALVIATLAGLIGFATAADAKKAPKPVWQVTRTTDPITGATSCVVAAFDQAAGMSFTRMGALYPFVENSSVHGVLVGVSSGGRYRLPTGDILWRVDNRPFRTLRAADNPRADTAAVAQAGAAMQQVMDEQMKLIAAATATSTVASGTTARAMLDEMLAGQGLVYRAAAATAAYGLPSGAGQEVGRVTKDGLRPYPLDDSVRAGLSACAILPPDPAKDR